MLLILCIALISLMSCSKDSTSPDPVTKADIVGSVNLYDQGTTQVDHSGMKIIVEGVTPEISETTDANGDFTLKDVPFGNYNITYDKTGYGTYRLIGLEHTNTGSPTPITETPSLGQFSSTHVTFLSSDTSGDTVFVSVTTDPPGNSNRERYLRFFYSTDNTVSDTDYNQYSPVMVSKSNPFKHSILKSELIDMGFLTGTTVYVKVYGESYWSNDYEDPDSGNRVFPNLNVISANAVSFNVP